MDIILATRNPSKIEQIKAIFDGSSIRIISLDETGITEEAVEDGDTLEQNAMKKAVHAYLESGGDSWTMSDDTGIFIDALDGAPGVYSGRWAGESASTEETMNYCLNRLVGVKNRSAHFQTVVAVVRPDGAHQFFYGTVHGHILNAPRVPPQPKMPYSAIFVHNGTGKAWAEMTIEEENEVSHRGHAFRETRKFLEAKIEQPAKNA